MSHQAPIALGKPADEGEKILGRRFRLTAKHSAILHKGGSLLDVGCGNGALTGMFQPHFDRVVGADIQTSLLKLAPEDGEWVCSAGEQMPFPDQSFDAITCFEVLEHVQDPVQTMREFHRILKVGGQAVISVPNKWWIFETHGAYLPYLPWNRVPFFSWLPDVLHSRWAKARIYTRRRLLRQLGDAGFDQVRLVYITAPMDRAKPKALQDLLQQTIFAQDRTMLPTLAVSHLAVATRIA
ncbi:class I SAM-dependent methyltransferase [bacterium]|nr:class I SAM-dependent methyltransferase [bacterium]